LVRTGGWGGKSAGRDLSDSWRGDRAAGGLGETGPVLGGALRTLFGGLPTSLGDKFDAVRTLREAGGFVSETLAGHSIFSGEDPSRTDLQLFDRESPAWEELRSPYIATGLAVATAILLADPTLGGRGAGLALRLGFGLDPENMLGRDRLFGRFGRQPQFGLREPQLPKREIDFNELYRRTCMVGVMHALNQFGRAVSSAPREWSGGVIDSIKPGRGCAGDIIEIDGHHFGPKQPPGVALQFTAYTGGYVVAPVDPANWTDTRITVTAPAGVGNGPVGFVVAGATMGATVASAAEQLAGEAEGCLGLAASGFAQTIRQLGPELDAPHVSSSPLNHFAGGPPKIIGFTANGATRALLRPRGPLVLAWLTENADSVTIQTTGPPELPVVPPNPPVTGEQRFGSVNATTSWTGSYTLIASNKCGQVQKKVDVDMRERRALVLAGGGSKGAFEVGAVRCLQDVFAFTPDLLCGASVGSLNAAKLAEGPGTLPALEKMWMDMQDSSDLYVPTGFVTRLVNDLASLGIKYVSGIDLADLLGVRLANESWLSPDAQIGVGVVKHVVGAVSGAGTLFTVSDLILGAAQTVLLAGKVKQDIEQLLMSQSLFLFDPVRQKIDSQIDPAKIAGSGLELRIAVVNLTTGQTRYVDQRARFVDDDFPVNLRDALQASASIPIAFPPMALPGGTYVDGGVRDNAPLKAADIAGASSVIAVLPSPDHMASADYSSKGFPTLAARSFEAMFDELLQDDLAPFRGYNMPVTIIAPQVETHSLLRVDPGLVQIDMDYGYMRAYDELQPDPTKRQQLRQLSTDIVTQRIECWDVLEHASEGKIRDEERALMTQLQPVPDAGATALVRAAKIAIRGLCGQRQTLVKDARANPPMVERVWQQWERHKWTPLINTPWEATTAHVGTALTKVAPPAALPPP
jgi:predicted acylesterase/phospholipase RssA